MTLALISKLFRDVTPGGIERGELHFDGAAGD
jgi:hypothetical protein